MPARLPPVPASREGLRAEDRAPDHRVVSDYACPLLNIARSPQSLFMPRAQSGRRAAAMQARDKGDST